jgi:hypothetical protein
MKTSFKRLLPLLLLALPAVMQAQFNYMDNGVRILDHSEAVAVVNHFSVGAARTA